MSTPPDLVNDFADAFAATRYEKLAQVTAGGRKLRGQIGDPHYNVHGSFADGLVHVSAQSECRNGCG